MVAAAGDLRSGVEAEVVFPPVVGVEGAGLGVRRAFLSNEMFPMWMGSVSKTSGDFIPTYTSGER